MMKKVFFLVLACSCVFMTGVFASNEDLQPIANAFFIDGNNTYCNMENSYSQGYVPEENNGFVNIVLPLLCADSIKNSAISINVDFGDTASSPFRFVNMRREVQLRSQPVNNYSDNKDAYLIDLNLPLEKNYSNGKYLVRINISYILPDGREGEQSFPIYVTLTAGSTDSEEGAAAPAKPKIRVLGYSVDKGEVFAGNTFKLSIKLTSLNGVSYNIKASISDSTNELIPDSLEGPVFIKKLNMGESTEILFNMKAIYSLTPEIKNLALSVEYDDNNGNTYSLNENTVVEAKQPLEIDFEKLDFPKEAVSGEVVLLRLTCYNTGRSAAYNVTGIIESQGLVPESKFFFGTVEAGTAKTEEIYVLVADLNTNAQFSPKSTQTEKYGPISGTLKLAYEDQYKGKSSKEQKFQSTILQPLYLNSPSHKENPNEPSSGQWWISIIIVSALIMLLGIIFLAAQKIKRGKNVEEDEG